MTELSRRDESLVMPVVSEIAKEPGLAVRDLCALIGKNMSTTLRVVQKLVDAGVVERRRAVTSRYSETSGLWLR